MIELGKMQTLTVLRIKEFGVYLGHEGEKRERAASKKAGSAGNKRRR
ncbi:MAG: S1-like domain-containing RNA-binding protein [Lachnospiraceae bacterium]